MHVVVAVKIQTKTPMCPITTCLLVIKHKPVSLRLARCPWDTATIRTINAGSIRRSSIDCPAATLLLFISWFNKKLVMLQIAPAQAIIIRINN